MNLKKFPFQFKPGGKGMKKILGDLEAEIMAILWARDESTVRNVYECLRGQRQIAYTTVMTVMSRLAEKGILLKDKKNTSFLYRPAVSREEFTRSTLGSIFDELLGDFGAPVISQFVETVGKEDPGKMEELARLIDQKRREGNE